MTIQILLLLITIGISLILFSFDNIPADVVALGVIIFLTLTGILPADKAFSGFGSEAVLLILGLLILTAALNRTGVVDLLGQYLNQWTGGDGSRLFLIVLICAAVFSSFISNTATTAFFIPIVIGLARRLKISSSRYLMPLAFASILSSSVTLVATSTNIVVSGLMTQYGLKPLTMFELTPVGLPILILGLLYMLWIGKGLIPERAHVEETLVEIESSPYFSEVVILPGSPLNKKSLFESGFGHDLDLTVLGVVRDQQRFLAPGADFVLAEGDTLFVEGQLDNLLRIQGLAGIDFKANVKLSGPSLQSDEIGLVEAIILLRSPLIGRTLKGLRFREKYGLQVLAINRHGETIQQKISEIRLELGDILLVQGHRSNIKALEADKTFRILGSVPDEKQISVVKRAPIAISAFIGSMILGSLNILPISIAVLLGVLIVFITRCITPEEAYREVEWKAIILIGCMLGVGTALEYTGAAKYLAMQIVNWFGNSNPIFLLSGFFILTMLLTQPMSNQAASAVIVPIAIQTAIHLDVNPRSFAVLIAVSASCSYLTPLEPACLMVYGPGRYRFLDFLKIGGLLTFIIFLITILFVPLFWPLK